MMTTLALLTNAMRKPIRSASTMSKPEADEVPTEAEERKREEKTMKIEHTILGNDMQAVEIEMQPGQEIVAEASTLLMMEDGITFDAKIGDGTSSGSGVMWCSAHSCSLCVCTWTWARALGCRSGLNVGLGCRCTRTGTWAWA